MWDRFTLIGPGTFWLGNGPNATDYVSMGRYSRTKSCKSAATPVNAGW